MGFSFSGAIYSSQTYCSIACLLFLISCLFGILIYWLCDIFICQLFGILVYRVSLESLAVKRGPDLKRVAPEHAEFHSPKFILTPVTSTGAASKPSLSNLMFQTVVLKLVTPSRSVLLKFLLFCVVLA